MPVDVLRRRLAERGSMVKLEGLHTDHRSKEDAFGGLEDPAANGDLLVPRHPELLRRGV